MLCPTLWLLIILIIINLNKQIRDVPNRMCAGYNIANKAVKLSHPPLNCCESAFVHCLEVFRTSRP